MAYAVAAARHNHNNNNVVDSGDKQTATASPSVYRYFIHIYARVPLMSFSLGLPYMLHTPPENNENNDNDDDPSEMMCKVIL